MEIKLVNAEQLQNLLTGIDEALRAKILKKALRLVAAPIIKSAESKVWNHQRTGRLYRSLGIKPTKTGYILGARKTGKFKGSHAHFLENGTAERKYITKKGKVHRTGRVKGIYYWSSSIEETSNKSEQEFQSYIIKSLSSEINSLSRKAAKL